VKLICYRLSQTMLTIRPAPATRDWMDKTPNSFAYRCLPLNIANAHGWEILSPCRFLAVWDGGIGLDAIKIKTDAPEHLRPVSHFGSGVLTFHVHGLFRTEPGVNLFVTGPVNLPKDGITALSGVIESDWSPYTFTMNWKFTRPGAIVEFTEGEPFCFFFPLDRSAIEAIEPEIRDLAEDPETEQRYRVWVEARNKFNRELPVPGSEAQREKWQKTYYRGSAPDGTAGPADHQIKLRIRPFVDKNKA